jgi:ribonuclease T1
MTRPAVVVILMLLLLHALAFAESCETVVHALNTRLSSRIDEQELVGTIRSLNNTNNRNLPPKYVSKRKAREQGWRPGRDLWSVNSLRGSSIGGDRFKNREGRLPNRPWREADLDYQGGHRGSKRLIFSRDGERYVTVDHYRSFVEVPACQ